MLCFKNLYRLAVVASSCSCSTLRVVIVQPSHRVVASRRRIASSRRCAVPSCRIVALLRCRTASSRHRAASLCRRCRAAIASRHRVIAPRRRVKSLPRRRYRQTPHCFWLVVVFGCRAVVVCVIASRHRIASSLYGSCHRRRATAVAPSLRRRFWLVVVFVVVVESLPSHLGGLSIH